MDGLEEKAGYRRSTGSPRGQARRQQLLERVTDDLAANGLVDFSLRRAASAAGTTHKVLLYHFAGAEDLLAQAVQLLRDRRIRTGLAVIATGPDQRSLAERVRSLWPVLVSPEARVMEQAIGLAMYDPDRYAALGRGATQQNIAPLLTLCPEHWSDQRKDEVAGLILAALRGFLVHARTHDTDQLPAGFTALLRALEREEAAD